MYKFHNKIFVKVHFDTDFKRKLFCRHQNSNPGPSDSCLLAYSVGITFLIGICISQLDYFAPNCGQCSGGPSKGNKTTTEATLLSVNQRFLFHSDFLLCFFGPKTEISLFMWRIGSGFQRDLTQTRYFHFILTSTGFGFGFGIGGIDLIRSGIFSRFALFHSISFYSSSSIVSWKCLLSFNFLFKLNLSREFFFILNVLRRYHVLLRLW